MKYLLEYNDFLIEKVSGDLLDEITKFQKDYGNDKDILSKYNLRSLKNKRNAGYQKIYADIYKKRQIKESSDPLVPVIERIKEIDDECDNLLYLLAEFRRSMNDANSFYFNKETFDYFKGKTISSDEVVMSTMISDFFELRFKGLLFMESPKNNPNIKGGYGRKDNTITIFYNNIFDGGKGSNSILDFIWGDNEKFNKKLEVLSLTLYHELTHKYQAFMNPENYSNYSSASKIIDSDIDYYWSDYFSNPLEIEAHAMAAIKQMTKYWGYYKILNNIEQGKFTSMVPNLYNYLKFTNVSDIYKKTIVDIVERRIKLNI